jgi:putative DeoR family transcriptional regulator (stage III sporulation protein D)
MFSFHFSLRVHFCQERISGGNGAYVLLTAHSIGGNQMSETLEQRACELAVYIIETGATVRATAKHFQISKSTVHKDLSQRLQQYNYALYVQVRQILDVNKQERHIRGGMATKRKYQKM